MKVLAVKFAILWVWFGFTLGTVYADTFSPATAPPGGTVTLTGEALPNSTRLAYLYCQTGCVPKRIANMVADAQGHYSLTFNIPSNATPGAWLVLFRLQPIPIANDRGGESSTYIHKT